MLAVGTVVMNRVNDPKFPHSVCAVVGQPNQFASGALWLPMQSGRGLNLAREMAPRVLAGERDPQRRRRRIFPHRRLHLPLRQHALRRGRGRQRLLLEILRQLGVSRPTCLGTAAILLVWAQEGDRDGRHPGRHQAYADQIPLGRARPVPHRHAPRARRTAACHPASISSAIGRCSISARPRTSRTRTGGSISAARSSSR